MNACGCKLEAECQAQRATLRIVLVINAALFVVEVVVGLLANSMGLLADSLDMLADASVYAISLYAVGRAANTRIRAATISGLLQVALGTGVFFDAIRRFFSTGEPFGVAMMVMGTLALLGNAICLSLIARHKHKDVSFRASFIFSGNDVIANVGVIASGLLVLLLGSKIPDLIIGMAISTLVAWGGINILRVARREEYALRDQGSRASSQPIDVLDEPSRRS